MRIYGGKYLDSHNYSKIFISSKQINVYGSNQESLFYDKKFVNSLKGKSYYEKIDAVVDHFIYNNKINYISSGSAFSEEGKRLLFHDFSNHAIANKIVSKYTSDRLETLKESETNNYSLNLSLISSNYDKNGNYNLMHQDYVLYDLEVRFLYDFIDVVFKDELAFIALNNGQLKITSLNCDKVVNLSSIIAKRCMTDICYAVSNHNQNYSKLHEKDQKQLKLEVKNGK